MSRARPFDDPISGERIWFNQSARATVSQLELLADWEDLELDDLLDEGLSQKAALFRLREAATPEVIPAHVLERRRERERLHGMSPGCRICTLQGWECEGRITRHHFVPRWLMLVLENYQAYAARSGCTIPICIGRHRDLHIRDAAGKSIVAYLRPHERKFAHKLLAELQEQHPSIFELIAAGDSHSYEYQLVRDFQQGLLLKDNDAYVFEEYQEVDSSASAVASG